MRARRSPTAVHLLLVMLAVVGVGAGGVGGAVGIGMLVTTPAVAATAVTPQIDLGAEHSCALRSDGTVWCWGRNQYGQLGDGTLTSRPNPVQVVGLSGVERISLGEQHTCALLDDGTVRCWGGGGNGQLGDGGTNDSSSPVTVAGLSGVTRIAAGGLHTCAVLTDGSARCWGRNDFGQIGNATTGGQVTSPAPVSGLTSGVSDITAGQVHSCALLADGTARCWGFGVNGRLGTGTTTDSDVPLQVLETGSTQGTDVLGGITALSAGGAHTCALVAANSGTVRCWGFNASGQIGDGGTSDFVNPFIGVSATASGGITAVSAGGLHTCDLRADGLAACWGEGGDGQLGYGSTADNGVPTNVSYFGGIASVSTGTLHSCAIIGDDTVRCWGEGGGGRLGDGETVDRTRPVDVLVSGTAATNGVAFSVRAAAPAAAAAAAASAPSVAVACEPTAPAVITVGTEVTCTVTGGEPDFAILWRAAVNPVIAEAGVMLDASGRGEFSFTVPALAEGEELTVELVDWTAPMSLGVVGEAVDASAPGAPVPSAVPAGDGGVARVAGVTGVAGVAGVAGLLTLLLATRVRPRRAHGS